MRSAKTDTARCTFCHKAGGVVERLVSSPRDAKVCICNECLTVCCSILDDQVREGVADDKKRSSAPPLPLCDPRIPELLDTLEQWVIAETQHRQSLGYLGRACRLAIAIMDSR